MCIALTPARATDFTVQNGQTVGSQTLTAPGDIGTIEEGGTIVSGGDGVAAAGGVDGVTVNNAGSITSNNQDAIDVNNDNTINNSGTLQSGNGAGDEGIEGGSRNTITNSGTITSAADDAIDINNDNTVTNTGTITGGNGGGDRGIEGGSRNTITNSGTITSGGDDGINVRDNNSIENSGFIQSGNSNDQGVRVGNNNTVTNSGTIVSQNNDAVSGANNNTVVNSGTIRGGAAGDVQGIDLTNNGTIINTGQIFGSEAIEINSGTIVNSGLVQGTTGIDNRGGGNQLALTNSGTIIGTGGTAINFRGGDDTLSLLPGSNIQGSINFGGGNDTLVVAPGLSIANTFNGTLPETINTNGAPFVVSGLQVAVVDPTTISMHDEMIIDLTNGISYAVFGALKAARTGGARTQRAHTQPYYLSHNGEQRAPQADRATRFWSQTFGVARNQRGRGPSVDGRNKAIGSVYGADTMLWSRSRLGGFVGGSIGEVSSVYGSQRTRTDSFYGGLYAGTQIGNVAFDLALMGGHTRLKRERDVANNLAAGGIQTARATFDGIFIAPELSVTINTGAGIVASGSFRYIGYRMSSFSEAGAADNLHVSGRDLQIINGRFQLARPFFSNMQNGRALFEPYIGIEGRSLLSGSNVDATLLGQSISFSPGGESHSIAAFAGLNLSAEIAGDIELFSNVEASFTDTDSNGMRASVGLKFKF